MISEIKICKMYENKNSLSDIKAKTGLSISKIYRILKKYDINTKRNSSDFIEKLYDYKIDNTYFEKIDTSEKAYILGFLYADGNLHKKNYHIKLKLQEQDKYILEHINKLLKSNKPLYFHPKQKETHSNQISLVISNKKIYNDLLKFGLYPNKTYDLKFKNILDLNLMSHFIRGYFDGDGWISTYENSRIISLKGNKKKIYKRKIIEAGFVGTRKICLFLQKFFEKNLNIKSYIKVDKRIDKRIVSLRIGTIKDIKKLHDFLYKDATMFLIRKKEKFKK